MFGLGMARKDILSRLFNQFNLKVLDLYLETWLWSPLICAEKALNEGVNIWDYVKTHLTILFIFNIFCLIIIIIYIIVLLFLLVYISLLTLLLLLKLILSPFLPLLFSIIVY